MMLSYLILLIFFLSVLLLILNYKNILMILISLEFMMINTIYMLYFYLNYIQMNLFFNFIFLTLSICEGILGLSILIYMIRCSGNDYLNLTNMIKW